MTRLPPRHTLTDPRFPYTTPSRSPQPRPTATPTLQVTPTEKAEFEDDRLVRAARALGEIGAWREQSLFLRALAQEAMTPADHVLAGQLAAPIGRPDLGVMIGRSAQANSLYAVAVPGFPPLPVPAAHDTNRTFLPPPPP